MNEFIFTHKNHLKAYFKTSDGEVDYIPGGEFILEIGACERTPLTPFEEAVLAAKLIETKAASKDIWLCLSGGVDSEAMALAFLAAEVPFKAAIMRFNNELNWFDIKHAVSFCENKNIEYRFFDLDILKFYDQKFHLAYCYKFRCVSPQIATHLELIKKIPGFPVFSWNPLQPMIHNNWRGLLTPRDLFFSYHRVLNYYRKPGVGFFFMYTPELVFSFLRLPEIQKFFFDESAKDEDYKSAYDIKCSLYENGGFKIIRKENKWTGFEKVKEYYCSKHKANVGESAYEEMLRKPLERIFPKAGRDLLIFKNAEHLKVY